MKKEELKRESDFIEILDSGSFHIDTDRLWDDLEPRLREDKRRRRLPWWIYFLGGIVSCVILYYLATSISTSQKHVPMVVEESIKHSSHNPSLAEAELYSHENAEIDGSEQDRSVLHGDDSNIIKHPFTSVIGANSKNRSLGNVHDNKKNVQPITNPSYERNDSKTDIKNTVQTHISTARNLILADTRDMNKESDPPRRKVLQDRQGSLSLLPALESMVHGTMQDISPSAIEILPAYPAAWTYHLGTSLGLQHNHTRVYTTTDAYLREYDYETDRVDYSAGIYGGVEHASGWRVQMGVEHHMYGATYRRKGLVLKEENVRGIQSYSLSADGVLVPNYGIIRKASLVDVDLNWNRRHRAYDLYGTLGKRLWNSNRLALYLDMGAGYNLRTTHTGYYIKNQEFGFTKITDGDHPYKRSSGWSLSGNIELAYTLNQNWKIGAVPYLRWYLDPLTIPTQAVKIKNSQIGAKFSIIYTPR